MGTPVFAIIIIFSASLKVSGIDILFIPRSGWDHFRLLYIVVDQGRRSMWIMSENPSE